MTFLAFMGWGTVYFAHAFAAIQQQLREEVVQLRAAQDQLTAERDRAQAQLAVALPEVIAFTKRPEDLEAKAPVTGSVSPPIPAGKPPRTPASGSLGPKFGIMWAGELSRGGRCRDDKRIRCAP